MSATKDLFESIGSEGVFSFNTPSSRTHGEHGVKQNSYSDIVFQIVKSAYIIGHPTPSIAQYDMERNKVEIPKQANGFEQRLVCTSTFHNSKYPRHDCVMIAGSNEECDEELWFGKAFALLRLSEPFASELVFVRYFDIRPPIGQIQQTLGCIKLSWSSIGNEALYGLVPISTIKGVVHVLRITNDILRYSKQLPPSTWLDDEFIVNRFYFHLHQEADNEISDVFAAVL
eukprot:IDg10117t1